MTQPKTNGLVMALKRALDWIDGILSKLELGVTAFVPCVLVFTMFLISADALGRYLFNKPLFFTLDLVSHFFLPIIMLMVAGLVLRQARHISVDMFASLLPTRLYQAVLGICLAATVPVFWMMTYRVALKSAESFENDVVALGLIPWPFWVEQAIYAVCMGLLTARLFYVAATNLLAAASGRSEIGLSLLPDHEAPVEQRG